jgi:TolB protein
VSAALPPTHDLVYSRRTAGGTQLWRLRLDPVAGASGVEPLGGVSLALHAAPSPDGRRIAYAAIRDGANGGTARDLGVLHVGAGVMQWLTATPEAEVEPAWSPDGQRIAFACEPAPDAARDICVMNADGSGRVNLTSGRFLSDERQPAWSPDGSRIAYVATDELGRVQVWTMRADGSDARAVTTGPGAKDHPTWSPDGARIAYAQWFEDEGARDLVVVPAGGGAVTRLTLAGDQQSPAWSPDGRYLAFSQPVNGLASLFTVRPDGIGVRLRTVDPSWGGATYPAWLSR